MDKRVLAALGVAIVAVGAGYYTVNVLHKSKLAPPLPPPVARPVTPKPPPPPLVSLEQSDDVVRQRAQSLSSDPKLAQWLNNDNIIRRIVAAASIVSEGNTPKDSLGFLMPNKHFSTMTKQGKIYLNPKSYDRYDFIGTVFESLDSGGAAKIFKDLKPLFQKAYEELGHPGGDAQDTLVKAINVLLDTPVVVGNIRLKPRIISYGMADPQLEKLSPAQKNLLRMGPENTTKIQNKLRDIALALGIPEAQLNKPQTYSSSVK